MEIKEMLDSKNKIIIDLVAALRPFADALEYTTWHPDETFNLELEARDIYAAKKAIKDAGFTI